MLFFTKGPWVRDGWTVVADHKMRSKRGMIADVGCADMYRGDWISNADLISAAPDLLYVAQLIIANDIMRHDPRCENKTCIWCRAKDAIQKSEGIAKK